MELNAHSGPLRLRLGDTFLRRFLGVHALGALAPDEGLLLMPCWAVHTFFLGYALDIVFLDAQGRECARVERLRPYRVAWASRAALAVELPSGYCRRHPDYQARIQAALAALALKYQNEKR